MQNTESRMEMGMFRKVGRGRERDLHGREGGEGRAESRARSVVVVHLCKLGREREAATGAVHQMRGRCETWDCRRRRPRPG
jgi:hypothetical protein